MAVEPRDTSKDGESHCASPGCENKAEEGKYFCGEEHPSEAEYNTHRCGWCGSIAILKGGKYVCPVHGPQAREAITTEG